MPAQVAEEQDQKLDHIRSDMADRLALNWQRLKEEHASLLEAQAQVCQLACLPLGCIHLYTTQITQSMLSLLYTCACIDLG